MGRSIMHFTPVRANIAQKLRSREYLHSYPCQECGFDRAVTVWQGNRSPLCRSCSMSRHGLTKMKSNHPIYTVWKGMKERCSNPNSVAFKNYGGRGISVCDEWHFADAFVDWCLANGWESGLQLDRIDVNGNYEPSNCRFVTNIKNCHNRRSNKLDMQSVRLIRMLCLSGISCTDVGVIFSVGKSTIARIMRFEIWPDV